MAVRDVNNNYIVYVDVIYAEMCVLSEFQLVTLTSKSMLILNIVSPLPVFTPEGTIGLPSVRPSVRLSVSPSV